MQETKQFENSFKVAQFLPNWLKCQNLSYLGPCYYMVKFFEYQIKCETHSFFHPWIYHLPFMESWFKTIMCDEVNRNLSQMHPALRSHHSHEITSLNYALRYYHNYIVFCVFFFIFAPFMAAIKYWLLHSIKVFEGQASHSRSSKMCNVKYDGH